MIYKKIILIGSVLWSALSYSVYQNSNSTRMISKETLSIKGKVIQFNGASDILVGEQKLKTLQRLVLSEDENSLSLVFNEENVELIVEQSQFLEVIVSKDLSKSEFKMNFIKKKELPKDNVWELVTITAIYR
ncbi:MAG: hypothetical protein ACRC0V_00185 [Fusobacteriaceae bacterium]